MAPGDALFSVRVITDGPSFLSSAWTAMSPFVAVALGGFIGFRASVGAEKRKRDHDTYVLARSLAAELAAGQWILEKQQAIVRQVGEAARIDTMRYVKTLDAAMPVARAAAATAGQFVVPVAETLARFLLLTQNVSQQQAITVAMREDGVLTDSKLEERQLMFRPIAEAMVACGLELRKLLDQHYPQERT